MPFSVAEIRDRAQRLKRAVALERYRIRAGLEERPTFRRLYAEHGFLRAPEILPAIQRELSEATGEGRRRLTALFNWVAAQRVEADLAPLEDQLRAWEAGATVSLGEREIPLRRVEGAIMRTERRGERLAWEAARNLRVEEAAALRLDIVHRERESVAQLGLGGYVEAWERLAGINLHGTERFATEILGGSEDAYRDAFLREVGRRIGGEARQASRSDATWLLGMNWLAQPFALNPLLGRLRRDLERLGLPLPRNEVLELDLDRRPLKEGGSFCVPVRVPDEVIVVVSPHGGWVDARGLLHEIGHALHYTNTSATLAWEERELGDATVSEGFALLFESLVMDAGWVEGATGLSGAVLDEYMALAGFVQLYRIRRLAARLLWQLELASADRPGELASHYAERLGAATGFAHDAVTYLEEIQRGFWVARRLRAWMLSAIMLDALHNRFGEKWWADPAAGQFLAEILSAGQRDDAVQLARQLGQEGLTTGPLLARVGRWL